MRDVILNFLYFHHWRISFLGRRGVSYVQKIQLKGFHGMYRLSLYSMILSDISLSICAYMYLTLPVKTGK